MGPQRLGGAVALVGAALVALSPTLSAHLSLAEVEVHLVMTDDADRPFAFQPQDVILEAGGTVRWINDEDVYHTVTSSDSADVRRPNGTFNEPLPAKGATFEFTISTPGTYHYYCSPHSPFMFGSVVVADADASTPAPTGRSPGLGTAVLAAGLLGSVWLLGRRVRI